MLLILFFVSLSIIIITMRIIIQVIYHLMLYLLRIKFCNFSTYNVLNLMSRINDLKNFCGSILFLIFYLISLKLHDLTLVLNKKILNNKIYYNQNGYNNYIHNGNNTILIMSSNQIIFFLC